MPSAGPFFREKTVKELTPAGRAEANAKLAPLRPGLGLYSVVSRVDDATSMHFLLSCLSLVMPRLSGRRNDGLVVPEDAVLPGSRYALLEHVGHFDAVVEPGWKYRSLAARSHDRKFAADLTEAIVRWIFAR